jgi:hypothetical protein
MEAGNCCSFQQVVLVEVLGSTIANYNFTFRNTFIFFKSYC